MPLTEIEISGQVYKLGCKPRLMAVGSVFPVLSDKIKPIPRSEWKPVDWSHLVHRIHDQDGAGMCASSASAQTIECCRNITGLPQVNLSAGNLYGRVNGGRDQGSMLSDNLEQLVKDGICTEATVPYLDWKNWNKSGWKEEAAKYKMLEVYDAPSFDDLATAIQLGFFVNLGIMIGNNFDTGADGWIPAMGSGGGGHAMCGVGLCQKGNTWGIKVANSWTTVWGQKGFGIIPEIYFKNMVFTDGWAIRSCTVPSGEV